ncbi:hypothetical protein F4813DRAFT_389620 [Daldinia decipiens]|uniref:uncharacterized protein n=1 Tax=Daldinia decipiens TaxID=326647 RepID=UPI0020C4563D|nr:uncharacterized protein F4813DRAFT_389620 [Daldinia decipiens]KAI1657444.1 hypothetical protein F4813DRAFT_389620 [Daldinia decipiens]
MGGVTVTKHLSRGSYIGDDALADDPDPSGTVVVDGTGCTLSPGLIDCHVHIRNEAQLASWASFGVTAVCDMASIPDGEIREFQSPGENPRHGTLFKLGGVSPDNAVHNTDEAVKFVQNRIDKGVELHQDHR